MRLRDLAAASGSIRTAAVLFCVLAYGTLQGSRPLRSKRQGESGHSERRSFRSWLVSTRLARHQMHFQMRDGSRLSCRILDSGALLSVHMGVYAIPWLDWSR